MCLVRGLEELVAAAGLTAAAAGLAAARLAAARLATGHRNNHLLCLQYSVGHYSRFVEEVRLYPLLLDLTYM